MCGGGDLGHICGGQRTARESSHSPTCGLILEVELVLTPCLAEPLAASQLCLLLAAFNRVSFVSQMRRVRTCSGLFLCS